MVDKNLTHQWSVFYTGVKQELNCFGQVCHVCLFGCLGGVLRTELLYHISACDQVDQVVALAKETCDWQGHLFPVAWETMYPVLLRGGKYTQEEGLLQGCICLKYLHSQVVSLWRLGSGSL